MEIFSMTRYIQKMPDLCGFLLLYVFVWNLILSWFLGILNCLIFFYFCGTHDESLGFWNVS